MPKIQPGSDFSLLPVRCLLLVDQRNRPHPADFLPRAGVTSVIVVHHPPPVGLVACAGGHEVPLFVGSPMLDHCFELVPGPFALATGLLSNSTKRFVYLTLLVESLEGDVGVVFRASVASAHSVDA